MQRYLRIMLLAGMLITGYLLIMAWQKDYGQTTSTATTASTTKTTTTQTTPSTSDIPAVPAPGVTAGNADLPPALAQAVPTPAAATSNQLITAQTDLYRIYIDPVGGDIVRLELLKQKKSLNDNSPYPLLTQQPLYNAQSMLIGSSGPDSNAGRATYRSAQQQYTINQGTLSVPLTYTNANGLTVVKTYQLTAGQYPIQVSYRIVNRGNQPWQGNLLAQMKRDSAPDPNHENHGMMGLATYLGGAWGDTDQPYNKVAFDKLGTDALNHTIKNGWVGFLQHYFVSAWVPPKDMAVKLQGRNVGNDHYIGFMTDSLVVPAGRELTVTSQLFAGPKYQDQMKALAPGLERTVDYSWLWPVAQLLFTGLKFFHDFLVHNWGWAIILLTFVVKMVLFPLSAKSYKSMAKMKLIQPELERLKAEHGEDRAKFAQEMMALYKREQVNPLAGCLPLLLQMPIFLALYWVLAESVELRHAPWLGWIHDLSVKDPLFILPIIMGFTMYWQQMLGAQPSDPMQARVLKLLPIIFTIFMLWFPAGLVLYWIVNNLLTIVQQKFVTYQIEKDAARTKALAN